MKPYPVYPVWKSWGLLKRQHTHSCNSYFVGELPSLYYRHESALPILSPFSVLLDGWETSHEWVSVDYIDLLSPEVDQECSMPVYPATLKHADDSSQMETYLFAHNLCKVS